jgi:hypothetical protein
MIKNWRKVFILQSNRKNFLSWIKKKVKEINELMNKWIYTIVENEFISIPHMFLPLNILKKPDSPQSLPRLRIILKINLN